jgi:hypothetical protein
LTKTSRPHRTSPVVRGDYLYQVVLGFSSPPPPPNVPELKETSKPSSLREALMQHRTDSACAVCHERIDPLGFALESYDPIGRFRPTDDTGGKIDDTGEMMDGTKFKASPACATTSKRTSPNSSPNSPANSSATPWAAKHCRATKSSSSRCRPRSKLTAASFPLPCSNREEQAVLESAR